MKLIYGVSSNETDENEPFSEYSSPRPVSGTRAESPKSNVFVGASTPRAYNSATVGGRNERESVTDDVQCSSIFHSPPIDPLKAFEERLALLFGNVAFGEVWILEISYRSPSCIFISERSAYSSNT